jgi:hypothetical protein
VQLQQQQQQHSGALVEQAQQQGHESQSPSSSSVDAAGAGVSGVVPSRRRPLSPFAVGYDMNQLAAAAPVLDSSSTPDTQQL